MPIWLTFVCSAAVIVACAYLLYVILRPDRF
ncbi:potassium-transporting ATPase subunit F [Thermomonas sp. XSG]|nr:potassium-transporting ATPase subunit F [Thermomonas sp. XSG]QNU15011.1 potassium-transporting ATPase subunit F [Thermomonas sp. XSG]